MDGWMDGRKDGWMDGWMNSVVSESMDNRGKIYNKRFHIESLQLYLECTISCCMCVCVCVYSAYTI